MTDQSEDKIPPIQIIDWQGIYDTEGNPLPLTEEHRKMVAEQIKNLYCGIGSGRRAKILPEGYGVSPAESVRSDLKLWRLIKKYIFGVAE